MIRFRHSGSFKNTRDFLSKSQRMNARGILEKYGAKGVEALRAATPRDSGVTAESWDYKINMGNSGYTLTWYNTNVPNGTPIAILIQYGHGTRNGGYVQGVDYINPAMRPVFEQLADELSQEVGGQP